MLIIPKSFLDLAKDYAIPGAIASELFRRIVNKKSVTNLAIMYSQQNNIERQDATKKFFQIKREFAKEMLDPAPRISTEEFISPDYLEAAREQLYKLIGKPARVNPPTGKGQRFETDITISDLHFPFQDNEKIEEVLSLDGDNLNIAGDLFDFYAASRHKRTIDYITVRQEIALVRAFLEFVSGQYRKVRIIEGNHDRRVVNQIQEYLPTLTPFIVRPVELVAAGLPNVEILTSTIENTSPDVTNGLDFEAWFMAVYDDVLLAHFDQFMGDKATQQVDQWISNWDHILPQDVVNARVICQAHTHRLGMAYTPKGKALISTGCLCKPMPYQFVNHGKYQPPVTGYVKWKRDSVNNIVDLDTIQVIKL